MQFLRETTELTQASVIADIGSGTGILSALFLDNGNRVFGVEPNPEMRRAAEARFQTISKFCSVSATAEATSLPSASVDYAVAGQAFHWFDHRRTREEFVRILRPAGWAVLIWNTRQVSTPFLRAYEALLLRFATDYRQVRHENVGEDTLQVFFEDGSYRIKRIENEQQFDLEGVRGRLLSSSYVPTAESTDYQPMLVELASIFEQHEVGNAISFKYETEVHVGHVT